MIASRYLLLAMMAALSLVSLAMVLDERREFEEGLEMLGAEHEALATAVGADFESRLARYEELHGAVAQGHEGLPLGALLGGALSLEQKGSRVLLVAPPGESRLLATDGRWIASGTLARALEAGETRVVLARESAGLFGLPERMAIAAISREQGAGGTWGVLVIASAERLRTREQHAQLRFMLGLFVATALVVGFGGLALKKQRQQLEVARELEVKALQGERERLLARADKMATLAALSSGIAHEVATPLGTIMARVEQVLPALENDARASAALRVVLDQVQRIQTVIEGMLGLARGERPSLVKAEPGSIARAAAALVRHRFGESAVTLRLAIASELPAIACDAPMLEQALVNLLLNACDASARGGAVQVRVEELDASEGARVRFVVEDEGEGISPQTAERARKPFFTTKAGGRGTGLGLAIAQEVVAHHGGKLLLESRADTRGTRAVIELAAG